jgi:hypothetical protein
MGTAGAPTTLVDISSYLTNRSADSSADNAEQTTLNPTGRSKSYLMGLNDESGSFDVQWDKGGVLKSQLQDIISAGVAVQVVQGPFGNTSGYEKRTYNVLITGFNDTGGIGGLVNGSVSWQRTGPPTQGVFA